MSMLIEHLNDTHMSASWAMSVGLAWSLVQSSFICTVLQKYPIEVISMNRSYSPLASAVASPPAYTLGPEHGEWSEKPVMFTDQYYSVQLTHLVTHIS